VYWAAWATGQTNYLVAGTSSAAPARPFPRLARRRHYSDSRYTGNGEAVDDLTSSPRGAPPEQRHAERGESVPANKSASRRDLPLSARRQPAAAAGQPGDAAGHQPDGCCHPAVHDISVRQVPQSGPSRFDLTGQTAPGQCHDQRQRRAIVTINKTCPQPRGINMGPLRRTWRTRRQSGKTSSPDHPGLVTFAKHAQVFIQAGTVAGTATCGRRQCGLRRRQRPNSIRLSDRDPPGDDTP